jgi:Zn-dependent peptidase ImmA (M78 family)/DNA-binding XRE family transcriptional regulator
MGTKQYAYVNGEMLRWARSITPFDEPSDVEVRIKGITAAKLIAWENGEEYPSITEAKKLAKLYKMPFAAFYLSTPPKMSVPQYKDRRTMGSTGYYETSYNLWSEIRRISDNREHLLEFIDYKNEEIILLPLLKKNVSIQETAQILREFLGLRAPFKSKGEYNNDSFKYFRNLLEDHDIMVAQVYKVDLSEMKGLSIYYDLFSIVAVNSKDYERAKVFSLFHELAHLIRRSSSLCLMEFNERDDDEEKTCDKIAAETLMPEEDFLSLINENSLLYDEWPSSRLQSIGDKFGVSSVAVLLRLSDLGIIKKKEYNEIYKQLNIEFEKERNFIEQRDKTRGGFAPPHAIYLNQNGHLFPRMILDAYARGDIAYSEMRRTLGVGKKTIHDIERAVMAT